MKNKLYQKPQSEEIRIENNERILAGGSGQNDPLNPDEG